MSFSPARRHTVVRRENEHALWAAAVAGDRDAFAAATVRYRRELETLEEHLPEQRLHWRPLLAQDAPP